ncbi:MAG: 23S rRNA (adenine(2503)-C(2))-methyltransferase RlmN [Patescibacteria group bacterium]|jgi:23S rRNA (adenine-C8)-methyltransferase
MAELNRVNRIESSLSGDVVPAYRKRQVYEAVYQQYRRSYSDIINLPKELRERLKDEFGDAILSLKNVKEIKDEQADKILFETGDGNHIESVLMTYRSNDDRDHDYQSLCVSSQSGCALGCAFCATGVMGFKKNLEVDEITDQILYFLQEGKAVKNITFMGMGEPFANPNFFDALKVITDKDKMGYSQRHIIVSTVGVIPGIKRLQEEYPNVNLAFSLHSPFPEQRLELMPVSKTYPLMDVMKALKEFVEVTNKKVFLAYVLLDGVNDTFEHAQGIADLVKHQGEKKYLYHVNLIRYNPGSEFHPFNRPTTTRVETFQRALDNLGVSCTLRQSFGLKIDAACGQLRADHVREN